MKILAGDIGGTKTTLALVSQEHGGHTFLAEETFPSGRYDSLESLVTEFLGRAGHTVGKACFGVAGPVLKGRAQLTNLPWLVEEVQLRETLQLSSAHLLNDLEAIAYAVPELGADDLHTLNPGQPVKKGTLAVVAPGTGLGEAFLMWEGNGYRAYPSEGGHCSFAPRSETELDMLRYLWQHFEHVSYERVCSGMGLPNIYAYFRDSGFAEELPDVAKKLAEAHDLTPIIVNAALDMHHPSPLCVRTLEAFVSILGDEAGNLTLKMLATGGVYLAGGMPPRILSVLDNGQFMQTFQHKGRFAAFLQRIPVHVVLNSRTALLGAARYGLMQL